MQDNNNIMIVMMMIIIILITRYIPSKSYSHGTISERITRCYHGICSKTVGLYIKHVINLVPFLKHHST